MLITTKYDVGQRVWPLESYCGPETCPHCHQTVRTRKRWAVEDPWVIAYAGLNTDGVTVYVDYRTGRDADGDYTCGDERELFPTEVEAQAECDRRNAKESEDGKR